MITGIIAVVILIAVLPPAINNGETAVVIMAIVIAALLLFFGMVSRDSDRAYLNVTKYWAKGGPDGERKVKSRKARQRELREAAAKQQEWERIGNMWQEGDSRCPQCGGKIELAGKIMDKGEKKNYYMCFKCGRTYKGNPIE